MADSHLSYCGCSKAEDCWGQGGWHFYPAPKDYCFVENKTMPIHGGRVGESQCIGCGARKAEDADCYYKGMGIAFERCPAYDAARKRR